MDWGGEPVGWFAVAAVIGGRGAEEMVRGTECRVVESQCALGGGTTPAETIHSIAIAVPGDASELAARYLRHDPPIAGRIVDDRFTIEVRTLGDADRHTVATALRL